MKVVSYPDLPQPTDRVRSGYGICTDYDRFHRLSFLISQKPVNIILVFILTFAFFDRVLLTILSDSKAQRFSLKHSNSPVPIVHVQFIKILT